MACLTYRTARCVALVVVMAVACAVSTTAAAASLITNGGFEAGFTGWTRQDAIGSDGTFFLQSGTTSPVNGDPVAAPAEGIRAAMTDAGAPGSHVLYQDFLIPVGPALTATLSFEIFIGNRAFAFFTPDPPTLDFSLNLLNQQVRVDIMLASASPFSVAAADILANVYQSKAGDPLISGYDPKSADLTLLLAAHQGETLRLRFAETDNLAALQFGVDNVSLTTGVLAVPAPASLGLAILAMLVLIAGRVARAPLHAGLCARP